jgi:hypothetical protein
VVALFLKVVNFRGRIGVILSAPSGYFLTIAGQPFSIGRPSFFAAASKMVAPVKNFFWIFLAGTGASVSEKTGTEYFREGISFQKLECKILADQPFFRNR